MSTEASPPQTPTSGEIPSPLECRPRDTISQRGPTARRPVRGDSLLGLDLQGYVVTRILSMGGMGVVYEARHSMIGQRAAVKVLRPELSEDAEYVERFLREARALSEIKHRNIVEILNFGTMPGGGQFILMEFLEGETLRELITRAAPLPPAQALRICDEILSGLGAAHELGVVHRDLKPANVILCKQASDELMVKVLDFGLSRHFDANATGEAVVGLEGSRIGRASILAGTPEYLSPEQASGQRVDGRADLYCLGVVLFEMLTGRLPFEATHPMELLQQHRDQPPPRVSSLVPQIPEALDAFVDLLLSKAPLDRPSSARVARETVRELRKLPDPSAIRFEGRELPIFHPEMFAETVTQVPSERPPRKRRFAVGFLGLLFGILSVGLFVTALTSRASSPPAVTLPLGPPPPEPVVAPSIEAAPPPPAPFFDTPLQIVEAPRAVPPRRAPSAHPRPQARTHATTSPAKGPCVADESWRHGVRERIERLEQAALASVSNAADSVELGIVKARAHELTVAAASEDAQACEQVEAALQSWRATLK